MTNDDIVKMYYALKLHFNTESYDYFKYGGKIKKQFIEEYQYNIVQKLYKKYNKNVKYFLLANILENKKIFISDLLIKDCDDIYKNWLRRKESLTYLFKSDIMNLLNENSFNELFVCNDMLPIFLIKYIRNEICIETYTITSHILKLNEKWDKKLCENLVWKEYEFMTRKYHNFIKYDKVKFKKILSDIYKIGG